MKLLQSFFDGLSSAMYGRDPDQSIVLGPEHAQVAQIDVEDTTHSPEIQNLRQKFAEAAMQLTNGDTFLRLP